MSEDRIKDVKVMVAALCAIIVIACALTGMTEYKNYTYNKSAGKTIEKEYKLYDDGTTSNNGKILPEMEYHKSVVDKPIKH